MNPQILKYIYHEQNDIHEFIPFDSTRKVVDQYFLMLDKIIGDAIRDGKSSVLIMWNLENTEIFPLNLQNSYLQMLVEKYPTLPPGHLAYLTDRHSDIVLIKANYGADRKNMRKTFPIAQCDDAIQWLLDIET